MQTAQTYHVYALPEALLDTLTPRNLISQTPPRSRSPKITTYDPNSNGSRACNICLGAHFVDVDQQRDHFRSDWHRYNVKVRLNGGNSVTESAFGLLVEGLDDSLSGTASSDEESDSDSDAVDALVSKTKRANITPSPILGGSNLPQTALAWFHSPPSTQIGVYKALYPLKTHTTSQLSELKEMQNPVQGGRKWAMFMTAGGHFAGAIVRVSKADEDEEEHEVGNFKKRKPKKPKPDSEILRHKTFHRYTTRRKQGGSQGLNDNAKGNAKSAGAQLRRYGEQSLRDDIRNLLTEWAEEINDCERIWIRASGVNRRIFLDYEEAVIVKGDSRLRTFPFPTRRPTQSELSRCLLELTRVKLSHLSEEALREQDDAFFASLPKPRIVPVVVPKVEPEKPKQPRMSKEEELLRDKWSRLLEMITKGRSEPLKDFWAREDLAIGGINAKIPEWTGERQMSLLQVAVQADQEEITRWLLEDARADPTIAVPVGGALVSHNDDDDDNSEHKSDPANLGSRRTAYDLARSRGVRDVFRRCAADHPEWWDWLGAARVQSLLTKEMEEGREEKKKIRRKGLKDKVKEREAKEKVKEKDPVSVQAFEPHMSTTPKQDVAGPRRLGGAAGASDGVTGLTPEMRAKIEREKRARAAEARLNQAGSR